jgi:hypothetical protein
VLTAALEADEDKDRVRKAREHLHSRPFVACASIPVLGELTLHLLSALSRDRCGEIMERLHRHIANGNLVLFGLGDTKARVFRRAEDLEEAEPGLGHADAIIVACMLEDPAADVLYTTDPDIWGSVAVRKRARSRRKAVHELGRYGAARD